MRGKERERSKKTEKAPETSFILSITLTLWQRALSGRSQLKKKKKKRSRDGSEGLIILGTIYMIFYEKEVGRAEPRRPASNLDSDTLILI